MKKYFTILAVLTASCLHAQTHEETAKQFMNDLSEQKFQQAEMLTAPAFQAKADSNALKQIWQGITVQMGNFNHIDSTVTASNNRLLAYTDFEKIKATIQFHFSDSDKIDGFVFTNAAPKNNHTPAQKDSSIFPQKELSVKVAGGTLYGTLMLPQHATAQTPVALIIAGSGPTDRNGNSALLNVELNTYKLLAEALAAKGIASFRYDKRMVGASKNFAFDISKGVIENDMEDADSLLHFLTTKFSKVYVIGHSEGSLLGITASQKEKVAGFVSLEGAGENIALTLKRQYAETPDSARVDSILSVLKKGKTVDNIPANLQLVFASQNQPYLISWMKYEPQKEIKKLDCPILLLQGDKDWNVTVHDAENLKKAKPDAKLIIIHGIDHELRNPVADLQQYAGQPLNTQLTDSIVSFIKQ